LQGEEEDDWQVRCFTRDPFALCYLHRPEHSGSRDTLSLLESASIAVSCLVGNPVAWAYCRVVLQVGAQKAFRIIVDVHPTTML
jgi:hypothetical protein